LGHKARRRLSLGVLYLTSLYHGLRERGLFDDVETYCMFVGYPRSGHTLVGSLLDAHPEAIIGHGVDALRYLIFGFGRLQLFHLLLENSRVSAQAGRRTPHYDYIVPNQWQGRYRMLRVIGDKRGGLSTRYMGGNPALVAKLRRTVGVKVRYLHVVRNPYDNIATMSKKRPDRSLPKAVTDYFGLCKRITTIKQHVPEADMLDTWHEQLIAEPRECLTAYCRHLGLDAPPDYLTDCASILYKSPHQSRHAIEWPPGMLDDIARQMEAYPFLKGYAY
jgi:hypothetical protein